MKRLLPLLLLLGLLPGLLRAHEILIYGDIDYKPMSWLENNEMQGIAVAAVEHVRQQTGLPVRLVLQPWNRSYNAALAGKGGIIGLSYTRERTTLFDYSPVVYDSKIRIATLRSKAFRYKSVDDLRGKRIGSQLGASYGEAVDTAVRAGTITMVRDTSLEVRIRNLFAGNIDVILMSSSPKSLEDVVRNDPELTPRAGEVMILDEPLKSDPLYLGFRKGSLNPEVQQQIFDALARFKPPAQYQ
ncbi:substrate-binding periplasmic protein [Chitinilyticum litopenaei]|uniref:substrate-binding periplasmic protein n=1 Tax=Chitinilyticum litopenaei TaxID=1121276 RepID=UPI0003FF963E|nr:transporter substrate-binding domain-containing protein [Chitinilyticum litopenaei]